MLTPHQPCVFARLARWQLLMHDSVKLSRINPSSLSLYFYIANSTASSHLKISQTSLLLEFLFSLMREWSLQATTWIMIIVAVFIYKSHKQKSIKVSLVRLLNRHLFMKVWDQKLLPILCRKYEFYAEVYAVDVEEGTQDMSTKSSGWFLEVFSPAKKWRLNCWIPLH